MIINLNRVKSELGIVVNDYNEDITKTIPKAESKYRLIANYNFNWQFSASYTSGESQFTVDLSPDSPMYELSYGDLINGDGVPAETYVIDIDFCTGIITTNNAFTDDGTELFKCQSIEYWPVISSIIWYMIGKLSTSNQNTAGIVSKSVGPLSYTFDKSSINSRYGLPESLVQSIPSYAGVS